VTDTPQPGSVQIDMGRVVQRAAAAAGTAAAELYAELGMAREVIDVQQQQIAGLQQAAAERDAELARLRQQLTATDRGEPNGADART
jgi:protein involved in polysaccharide export with SLBB domain